MGECSCLRRNASSDSGLLPVATAKANGGDMMKVKCQWLELSQELQQLTETAPGPSLR